jgi:AcrR family transcriptional regulator
MRPPAAIDLRAERLAAAARTDGAPVPDDRESASRRRILVAAAEVFREKGFTGTRVIDIARRAGFTSGALYSYFDSRADLLAEAVAESSTQMLDELLETMVGEPAPEAMVHAVLSLLAEPLGDNAQMLLDGVALATREPVARQRLAGAVSRFREQLGSDGLGMHAGQADLFVVLLLGVISARALGLHDDVGASVRERLAACFEPDGSSRRAGETWARGGSGE